MSTESVVTEPVRYAGFWRRFTAFSLDMLALFVVFVAIAVFHGAVFGLVATVFSIKQAEVDAVMDSIGLGVSILVTWLYFAILESSEWQATFGKRVLGIVVTDLAGRRIGFIRATVRHFAKILSGLFAGTGFLLIAWTTQKQALHDGLASTLVIRRMPRLTA